MFSINAQQYEDFKKLLPQWAPETELDTPRGVMEVDQQRRQIGAQPTTLGAAIENTYLQPRFDFSSVNPNEADAAPRGTDWSSPALFQSEQTDIMGAPRVSGVPSTFLGRFQQAFSASAPTSFLEGLTSNIVPRTALALRDAAFPTQTQQTPLTTLPGWGGHPGASLYSSDVAIGAESSAGKAVGKLDLSQIDAASQKLKELIGNGYTAREVRNIRNSLEGVRSSMVDAHNAGMDAQRVLSSELERRTTLRDALQKVSVGLGSGVESVAPEMGAAGVPPRPPRTPVLQGAGGGAEPPLPPRGGPPRGNPPEPFRWDTPVTRASREAVRSARAAREAEVLRQADAAAAAERAARDARLASIKPPEPFQWETAATRANQRTAAQRAATRGAAEQSDLELRQSLMPGADLNNLNSAQKQVLEQRVAAARSGAPAVRPRTATPPDPFQWETSATRENRRLVRQSRRAADQIITASGEKPEPTGVGKVFQVTGAILRGAQRMLLGAEVSAITRQGRRLAAGHPRDTAKAWGEALPALVRNPEAAKEVNTGITDDLWGRLFQDSGGRFRALEGGDVASRDIFSSEFPANLANVGGGVLGAPVRLVGKIYRGTEQATVIGLNAQARNAFRTLVKNNWDAIAPGVRFEDFEALNGVQRAALNSEELKKVSNLIMLAQGRSQWLEKNAAEYLPTLNAAFLAPQWRWTRLQQAGVDLNALRQIVSDVAFRRAVDPTSKEIAKNAVGYYASGAAIMALMAEAGAKVGLNPFASNWGRIEFGPVSYDIWAGDAGWSRALAQSAAQRQDTRSGSQKEVKWTKPLLDWLRGGAGIAAGVGLDYVTGETVLGQKFNLKDATTQRLLNIYWQDIQTAMDAEMGVSSNPLSGGLKGAAQTIGPGFIGIGINRTKSAAQQKADAAVPGGDFNKASIAEQQAALQNTPGLKDALDNERSKAGGLTGAVEKIRSDFATQQQAHDQELARTGDKKAWYKASNDTQHDMDAVIAAKFREAGAQALSPQAQPGDTPDKWYLRVIAANSDPTDKTGRTVNWDAVERWRASLTPEQDKYIDDHMGKRALTPEDEKRLQFKRDMRQTGFWDIQDETWKLLQRSPIAANYKSASEYEDAIVAAAIAKMPPDATDATKERVRNVVVTHDPILKAFHEIANKRELPWIAANPQLANQAVGYGAFKATVPELNFINIKLGGKQ